MTSTVTTICFSPDLSYPVPSGAATRCAFGDLRSRQTILLFGDDNAITWLPAFSALGTDLHWRIVFLGKAACSAWSLSANAGTAKCRKFVSEEVAFATRLRARIIIPMGSKVGWRGTKNATVKQLRSEITSTLGALSPSHSRIILFQTIPQFNKGYTNWTPQVCLTGSRALLGQCESVIYHFVTDNTVQLALKGVAGTLRVPLIPTQQFFCSATQCTLFVTSPGGTYLVYRDAAHMSRYYSNWIFVALEPYLRPYLR